LLFQAEMPKVEEKPRIYVVSGEGPSVLVIPWEGADPIQVFPHAAKTYIDTSGAPQPPWELTVWDADTKEFLRAWTVEPEDKHLGLLIWYREPDTLSLFAVDRSESN
jgi:hypothetical protein